MTREEYLARFHANQRVTGFGINGATTHFPCPFCAAPDWLVTRIIDSQENLARGARCQECKRSARAKISATPGGGMSVEMVQTGGDDPPEFLPAMRREILGGTSGQAYPETDE